MAEKRYEIVREGEGVILKINYEDKPELPSVEDSQRVMEEAIDIISEVGHVTSLVFSQRRDYEYDYHQTQLLTEIADVFKHLVNENFVQHYQNLINDTYCGRYLKGTRADFQKIFYHRFKSDPIGTYVEVRRMIRLEKAKLERIADPRGKDCVQKYIGLLEFWEGLLKETKLISSVEQHLAGYKLGDRTIYKNIFSPSTKPDFMFTKLMAQFPPDGEEIASYTVKGTEITVFKFPNSVQYLYHIYPPEFKLSEEKYEVLDTAKTIMAEHKPKKEEFVNPERMREVFEKVGYDLLDEVARNKGFNFSAEELKELSAILVRYTVGFGLIEVLLQDDEIQDISVNSPTGPLPIFIVHGTYGDCYTNIMPTSTDTESWASKLRMISGRPLDEANQILDTELTLPGARTRVSVITKPLDPSGIAFSFRRHRDKPWTLPLFIQNGMLTPLAAGLISFLVDGSRTLIVAGTRSSGKTSVLGSILVEIMRRYRIITIEDTLELPADSLNKMGYNIQQMKVASALGKAGAEMSASDGIRSTLRLGDSALFVGEVRSDEAKSLYEAMRVGAAANVVAGTLHADSPYGVFDRVVNDIGVPRTSFKATDVIIVANPIKAASGIGRVRRITQITEIRKTWEQDPLLENGFVDLLKYDVRTDKLEPTPDLLNGDSEILKAVAGNIKGLAGNWDAVWDNILLRAKIKETLVKYSEKLKNPEMLEAEFVIMSNDTMHNLMDEVQEETGVMDPKQVFFEWESWLKRECKKSGLL